MAFLKVGSKSSVFVTHLEFIGSECQVFCQVGDVGGQADTLAERVAESVENGLASPVSDLEVGDLCLALFHEDNSWYRGRVCRNQGHSVTVYFIDYGNTETVNINNIREAPEYVLAIPALSTKCIVSDCTPLSGTWTQEEKKKIETMLHSGEFICEILGINNSDVNNEVYIVKLYNSDTPNTPIFVRPASSQSLRPQSLSVGQEYKVYVSYVDTARKFWVQLQNQENELESLMTDIRMCFAEDLPSAGDIVNPTSGQVCAACFSDDGAFYRGIVKSVQNGKCTVFFVDYGNEEEKSVSELFTLPQELCKLPKQAVPCSYRVENASIEEQLHKLSEVDGASILKVLSGTSSGYIVEISSIEQTLQPSQGSGMAHSLPAKQVSKLWQSYSSVIMQLDGIYDVCISHVDHPGHFYCQLLANAEILDNLMQAIDQVAHNYDRLTNLYSGYQCLAKFHDGSWYRGEVISSEVGKTSVAAVDFGFVEALPPSNLRNTDPNFKSQHAQAILCTVDLNKLDISQWQGFEIDKFKALVEKTALVAKVSAKKGFIHQIDLYETENGVEKHLNTMFQGKTQDVARSGTIGMQKTPNLKVAEAAPVASLLPPEVSTGCTVKLCFTATKLPYLYGQVTSTPVEKVAKLQTDLNTYFEKETSDSLSGAAVGDVCCTKYIDGGWYRGTVTSMSGTTAEVAFVDFGDSVTKPVTELKLLPRSLCELPQQCILCKIDNIPATVRQDKLEKGLINKQALVKLGQKLDGVYPTYRAEILDQQILEQFHDGPSAPQPVFKGASSRTFGRVARDDTAPPRLPDTATARKPSGDGFTKQDVTIGSTMEVLVTHVKDPSSFQVVLDKMNPGLDALMDEIHEYYNSLPPGVDAVDYPKLGQSCIAQFTEDKGWYRATVTGLKTDGMVEVKYVDYGNSEYTEKDALKSIKPHFMSLPAQAVECCLSGVSSSQGFWSPEHQVQFTEMVEEQSFSATFKCLLTETDCTAYKVELVDKTGKSINQKFGQMTGTSCPDDKVASRSVSSTVGQDLKITVSDSGWDEDNSASQSSGFGGKPRSFGGGGGNTFASRSSGFGSKPSPSASTDDSGWGDSGSGTSSGFGNKKTFGDGGGGFSSRGGSGGFGSSAGNSSGGGGFGGGSGGGSKDCFKCGESGHFSRECPNAAKAGGGGGRDCYKCGESGHMARDCPNPAKAGGGFGGASSGGGRDCYKCGESGHMARDCTNPPKAGAGGGGGRDCFKCGESGHMARDCTNPPKAGGGSGGRECYKCGEGGHMARDCTNPPKAGGGGFGGRGGGGRDCYKCGESGHMARDCTNPPKEGAGPRKGFGGGDRPSSGGFGGGDRPSSGGFGGKSGGFGTSNTSNDSGSTEDWGSGGNTGSGFGSKSGGFGSKGAGFGGSNGSSGGFGSKGGFGGASSSGGGFGSGGGGGGFGKRSEENWGDRSSKPAQGGGFVGKPSNKNMDSGGGDDWDMEVTPAASTTLVNRTGDGTSSPDTGVLTSLTLDVRDTVDVYVVYTANPELFWCQIIKNCPSLEKLMEEINSFYNSLPAGQLMIDNPEIGMPCAAKFSEDNMWYRAEILTPVSTEIEVQFVDYGNTETVKTESLRKLKPEFMKLEAQGIRCTLDGVVAADKVWTTKATEDFEELTQDKHLVARVVNRLSDMTHILDIENMDEKINISETMCERGHCVFKASRASPVKEQIVRSPYSSDIRAGEEIEVYVSWIESPEQFWIQPVSQENDLVQLVDKIQAEYASGAGVALKSEIYKLGQAVVAQFSEDEAWYRGYVEKCSAGKYKVRFIDYGNADTVTKDSMRLPTDELLKEKSKAAMCKLVGVRPLQAGVWTSDARDIMDGLVKDVAVKCMVVSASEGCLSVELVSKGINVKEELIQAAVVRGEKKTIQGRSTAGSQLGVLTFSNHVSLVPGTTEAVYVSQTDSVASFWCQLSRTAADLEEVMTKLESHCQSGTAISNFPMDMACAARFSVDSHWYRAKVTANYPDSVEVFFVDYGNTEKVAKSDVCELTEELVQLPPQAIECELLNANKASNQLTAKFTELVGDQEVQATVIEVQDDSAIVSLTLLTGEVVGEKLGLSAPGSTPISTETTAALPVSHYPAVTMPSAPTSVFVTQIINPSEFFIQCADKESELTQLMSQLADYCNSNKALQVDNPAVGQSCCAMFSEDGEWYRGKVLKVVGSKCTVEFVDYGNSEEMSVDKVKVISPKFMKDAPFALKCQLEGVAPVAGSWSEDCVKKFEELAVEKDLICKTMKGTEVMLLCNDVDISEALVESGFAKRLAGSKSRVKHIVPTAKALSLQTASLPSAQVDVYVSHVNSPTDFYIQLVSEEEELSALMETLAEIYESSLECLPAPAATPGQAVCAKYSEDEAWYRAEIVEVSGGQVKVLFVDYGNSEDTSTENLKPLTEDLVSKPAFARKCCLAQGLHAGSEWCNEAVTFFETLTADKVLQCECLSGNEVILKADDVDVLDALVEKGYATRVEKVPSSEQQKFASQSVPADSVGCYVSHIEDDGLIFVQLACEEESLLSVVEQVQKPTGGPSLDMSFVKQGDNLGAKFSEDQSWYRAEVLSVDGSAVEVRFVDYGNCDTVTQSTNLRALSQEQLATAPLAYACRLQNLKSLNQAQCALLKEMTLDKELMVTFNKITPEFEIHLVDESGVDIEQSLAPLRESAEEVTETEEQIQEETEDKEAETDSDQEESLDHLAVPDVDLDSLADSSVSLKAEKLEVEQRAKVVVSHCESPSRLWVQLESKKGNLDGLLNTMFDLYTACKDSRLKVDAVCKDMVVAALYSEDESWYRAKVMHCDTGDDVTVMFVDHGNTEVVQTHSLRRLPLEFCQLSTQAIECCLGAVQPCSEEWSDEAIDAFRELTADKVLLLDVGGEEKGVYKVQLLDMGMSISDLLLQRDIGAQIATPVAVSSKVKQVFSPDSADEVITRLYSARASQTVGQYGYLLRDLSSEDPSISSHSVVVTSITSPVDFWCRLQDNAYEFYQDMLQEKYAEDKELVTEIEKGTRCVVNVENKEFQRATVISSTDKEALVKLVDIGCDTTVPLSCIFNLKPELEKYPQLAFCCSLSALVPVDGDTFTEEVGKVFKEIVVELSNETQLPASAKATVVNDEDGTVHMELRIDRKDIAESLVEKGVAKFEDDEFHKALEIEDEIIGVVENFGDFKNVQLALDSDYDVVLVDCYDINRLVFHTKDSLETLKEIAQSIEATVGEKTGGEGVEEDFVSGPCLAKCPEDGVWYRANLKTVLEEDSTKYQVFLVDYGSSYDLPRTSLLPIPDSLKDRPGQAILCRLGEVEPAGSQWTEDVFNFFTEQYMREDVELIVYVSGYTKGIHEVLLSTSDDEKTVNHLLAEIGLAVPVLGSQVEMSLLADIAETSFNEVSMMREDSFGDSTEHDAADSKTSPETKDDGINEEVEKAELKEAGESDDFENASEHAGVADKIIVKAADERDSTSQDRQSTESNEFCDAEAESQP